MRIISGTWRSRTLVVPGGLSTRPTADRVRETLFSMLQSRLGSFEGLRVLDLFAGSGAMGLEALSRGAEEALMVESDAAARRAIEANIRTLGANARLAGHDATALPAARAAADCIILDPPYHAGLALPALASALAKSWVGSATWIALETANDEEPEAPGFSVETRRKVGKAGIHILRPA